jgi:hypothetical protein
MTISFSTMRLIRYNVMCCVVLCLQEICCEVADFGIDTTLIVLDCCVVVMFQ